MKCLVFVYAQTTKFNIYYNNYKYSSDDRVSRVIFMIHKNCIKSSIIVRILHVSSSRCLRVVCN